MKSELKLLPLKIPIPSAQPTNPERGGGGEPVDPSRVGPKDHRRGRHGNRQTLPGADVISLGCEPQKLQIQLAAAISGRELQVHFQGQFDLDSGQGFGVEALARWPQPDGQQISPDVFIPLAERTGLICGLGAWVLRHACETVAAWPRVTGIPPTLSVNVSGHQINETFCAAVAFIIETSGLPAQRLELEITESTLIANMEYAVECLTSWKALGVHIALDDFGTGCSSFYYLARLPVDRLKLDKQFVHRMIFERKTAAIVRSTLALATDLGITVLAEGIESEEQLHMLQELGCRMGQGYLFAKPAASDEARSLLETSWGRRSAPIFQRDTHVREFHAP